MSEGWADQGPKGFTFMAKAW
ncbi:MAG: hypothetical protein ACE5JS_14630 [Nitrospinota bacterium]